MTPITFVGGKPQMYVLRCNGNNSGYCKKVLCLTILERIPKIDYYFYLSATKTFSPPCRFPSIDIGYIKRLTQYTSFNENRPKHILKIYY